MIVRGDVKREILWWAEERALDYAGRGSFSCTDIAFVHSSSVSKIFRLILTDGRLTKTYYLKALKGDKTRVSHEAASQQLCSEAFPKLGGRVVAPAVVGCWEEEGCMLDEGIEGLNLRDYIRGVCRIGHTGPAGYYGQAEQGVVLGAEAALALHSIRTGNKWTLDGDAEHQSCSRWMRISYERGYVSRGMHDSVVFACDEAIHALSGQDFEEVAVHGDFAARNMLLNYETLCLLDFQEFTYGSPYTDVAHFLASLPYVSPMVHGGKVSRLAHLFLRSMLEQKHLEEDTLTCFLLIETVRACYFTVRCEETVMADSRMLMHMAVRKLFIRRFLSRMLGRAIRDMRKGRVRQWGG